MTSVIPRHGRTTIGSPVGAAFEHPDGKGYNVILQALPIDGKLVLRVPKDDEDERHPPPRRDDKSGQRRG